MEISLSINRSPEQPLYRALAEAISKAIISGQLSTGQALPSVRALAETYGVSVDTAVRCYEDLASRGMIETIPKTGTFVRSSLAETVDSSNGTSSGDNIVNPEGDWSQYAKRLLQAVEHVAMTHAESTPELTAIEHLPLAIWQKLISRHQKSFAKDLSLLNYAAQPAGIDQLRVALVEYLARTRGVRCRPEQILITAGSRIDILCRLLIDSGDNVVVENPCYPSVSPIFASYGAIIHPADSDEDGILIDRLAQTPSRMKLLYTAPSHQDPTGTVMSSERRKQLLDWATDQQIFVWESDVDHHFRYGTKPTMSLQALDVNQRVIYSGSFWPILGPLAKVGYIVIPKNLLPMVMRMQDIMSRDVSVLEQYALADFISEGHLERHVLKIKKVYARKRQKLMHALALNFGDVADVSRASSGVNIVIRFSDIKNEEQVAYAAVGAGLSIKSSRPYYLRHPRQGEFLIPFSSLDEERIPYMIESFASRVKQS